MSVHGPGIIRTDWQNRQIGKSAAHIREFGRIRPPICPSPVSSLSRPGHENAKKKCAPARAAQLRQDRRVRDVMWTASAWVPLGLGHVRSAFELPSALQSDRSLRYRGITVPHVSTSPTPAAGHIPQHRLVPLHGGRSPWGQGAAGSHKPAAGVQAQAPRASLGRGCRRPMAWSQPQAELPLRGWLGAPPAPPPPTHTWCGGFRGAKGAREIL